MVAQYVSGRGYTVRNSRGLVIAHSLTAAQRDALLAMRDCGVITSAMLLGAMAQQ